MSTSLPSWMSKPGLYCAFAVLADPKTLPERVVEAGGAIDSAVISADASSADS